MSTDDRRPTYSERDLCKHAADFVRSRPELTWDEALEKARGNFKACGYVPEPEPAPEPPT